MHVISCFYRYRSQGKNFLKDALSEDQLRFRRKQVRVNIKVTFLSWIIETTAGIALLITWIFASERSIHLFRAFIILVAFVFTPSTYILNRETTKQIIILENWLKDFKPYFCPFNKHKMWLKGFKGKNWMKSKIKDWLIDNHVIRDIDSNPFERMWHSC